jgi:hypothetical protein
VCTRCRLGCAGRCTHMHAWCEVGWDGTTDRDYRRQSPTIVPQTYIAAYPRRLVDPSWGDGLVRFQYSHGSWGAREDLWRQPIYLF